MTAAIAKARSRLLVVATLMACLAQDAFAACTSPTGTPGDIEYSVSQNVMAYCNGIGWVSMGASGSATSFATLTIGDLCTATSGTSITCTTAGINLATQVMGVLTGTNGGTGVNNGANTITLGGNLTTAGAFPLTLTTTASTNVTLPTSGTLLATTGTPAQGDILYYNGTAWTDLAHGTSGQYLQTQGASANPLWSSVSISTSTMTGTVQVSQGGTGDTSLTANGLLLGNGTGSVASVGPGALGTVLIGSSGAPLFSNSPSVTNLTLSGIEALTFGADYTATGAQNDVNVGAVSSVRYNGNATATFEGIVTGTANVAGALLTLHNASTSALTLADQGSTTDSTLANRIVTGTGSNLAMAANSSVLMQYDGTLQRWRVIGGSGSGGTLAGLSDVSMTSPATNNLLQYNGTKWVNAPQSAVTSAVTAAIAPSFSANNGSSTQTVTAATWTKMTLGTESFDTNNNFASSRYTPTVAGKYILTGTVTCPNGTTACDAAIYKNGASVARGSQDSITGGGGAISSVSVVVDMNGTTDYVELWGYNATDTTIGGNALYQRFDGGLLAPLSSGSVAGTGIANYTARWSNSTNLTAGALTDNGTNVGIGTASPNASGALDMGSTTGAAILPVGTTGQEPTGVAGMIRYNSTTKGFEGYGGATPAWGAIGGGTLASLTDVSETSPVSGNLLEYNGTKWVNATVASAVSAAVAPSLSVYRSTTQTVTANTPTKLAFDTVTFDTNNNWSAANNRYIPTIAGKYLVLVSATTVSAASADYISSQIMKNGVEVGQAGEISAGAGQGLETTGSVIVDMNGTTDYIEGWTTTSRTSITGAASSTYMYASLIAPLASGSVAGTGIANYTARWSNGTNLTTGVLTDNGTNVGIGTASPNANVALDMGSTTGAAILPVGTTGQEPTGVAGMIRYNSTTKGFEGYGGVTPAWGSLGGASALASLSDVTLTSPAANNFLQYNGTKWVNVPQSTITSAVSAAVAPSFSVNNGATAQTVTAATWTKMTLGTVSFDTISGWSTANNRYTPTVAGKYIFNGEVICNTTTTYCIAGIYKNGAIVGKGSLANISQTSAISAAAVILDMDGTTDYVELWGLDETGTAVGGVDAQSQYLSGALLAPLASGSVAGTGIANYTARWSNGTNLTTGALTDNGTIVGIGTTSPATALQVNGTITTTNIIATSGAPQVTVYASGSGTYTTPTNALYLVVEMVGGGGGGGSASTNPSSAGGTGGSSTFGTSLLTAAGGGAGTVASGGSTTGGSASGCDINLRGGPGLSGGGAGQGAVAYDDGGAGGNSVFGGGAYVAWPGAAGGAGNTNTGGGGGGGAGPAGSIGEGGGGSGGYCKKLISGPAATYAYSVGGGGGAGAAGSGGANGAGGGSGIISVTAYFR
jgi:fibronectin-binding autotransporter adhesin